LEKGVLLEDTNKGKVTLLVNLTLNEKYRKEQLRQLAQMKTLAEKYEDLSVLGQFAYDIQ
jgi:hypothetical protein